MGADAEEVDGSMTRLVKAGSRMAGRRRGAAGAIHAGVSGRTRRRPDKRGQLARGRSVAGEDESDTGRHEGQGPIAREAVLHVRSEINQIAGGE